MRELPTELNQLMDFATVKMGINEARNAVIKCSYRPFALGRFVAPLQTM